MGLLRTAIKENMGFSIYETLVSIVIVGITITLSISVLVSVISNPVLSRKKEALLIALACIDKSIADKSITDTTFSNSSGTLLLTRTVTSLDSLNKISVEVKSANTNRVLIHFEALTDKLYDYK